MKLTARTAVVLVSIAVIPFNGALAQETRPAAATSYEYKMPADANRELGLGCGVFIGFNRRINNVQGSSYGRISKEGDGKALLSLFEGSFDETVGKGLNHPLVLETNASADSCTLRVAVDVGTPFKKGFMNMWKLTFSSDNVMRETPKFVYEFEISSPYSAEATTANFDRLAGESCGKDTVSGMFPVSFQRSGKHYCVQVNNRIRNSYVKCLPYRTGSMCRVQTILTAKPDGNSWDLTTAGEEIKAAVKAIIEN